MNSGGPPRLLYTFAGQGFAPLHPVSLTVPMGTGRNTGDYLRTTLNGPDLSAEMQSFAWPYLHPEKSTAKGKDKPEALMDVQAVCKTLNRNNPQSGRTTV